jgi:hypothetical protein
LVVDIKRSFFKAAVKAKLFFRGQRNILWAIEVICYNIRKATQIVTQPNENRNHLPRFPAPLNSDNISIWPNKLFNKFSPTNSTQIWNEKKNHRIFFLKILPFGAFPHECVNTIFDLNVWSWVTLLHCKLTAESWRKINKLKFCRRKAI